MQKFLKICFLSSILLCIFGVITIVIVYALYKPNLPEINLVDQAELQMPLKVYTKDKILIGEFGEIKRRSIDYEDIPENIRNAFLAAEDDNFFNHQGLSYTGLIRSFIRCLSPSGCQGGGGTITMQVVRGYLLTREQTIDRKIKEIFLALELEGELDKEEIFELYVNRIFLGNRSYGIEAAANTYFNKSLAELSLSESATIASLAQLPSRINPVKNPRRTLQRRNWILSRMLMQDFISEYEYEQAISEDIKLASDINLYEVDGSYISELVRQEIIKRYGLNAYKEGWSVYTTIDSVSQNIAQESMLKELFEYDKRHGWRKPQNYAYLFSSEKQKLFKKGNIELIFNEDYINEIDFDKNDISNQIINIFDEYPYYKTHLKAIVVDVTDYEFVALDQNFELISIKWSNEYEWARNKITINKRDKKPQNFNDLLIFGDFVYLKADNGFYTLDQIPLAEASLISINPKTGEVISYLGGKNFNDSNFDRVRQSYPQSGSSFKPFIYSAALSNGYNLSTLINDAPISFEDKNLESVWRPQNYTGEFYGPISIREALTKSVNIVSIKILRELGISKAHNHLKNFGFKETRLPNDLSLALGSGNFSSAEMVRAYSVIANTGLISNLHYIDRIEDRYGNTIFSHNDYNLQTNIENINAFPWLNTIEMNINRPYYLLPPINSEDNAIDIRVSFLVKDILKGFLKSGVAGRKSAFLERDDIGGKTGTTNESVSTWFSGFHNDLVTTVWVGTDDFTSLGEDEYGSTIALPIWLNYMDYKLKSLEVSQDTIPSNISFVRVNKDTGEIDSKANENFYFELFLDENIN
tara:strand:+ start:4934 stop:7372 length:2439 start_codon:yes stop_codon:yes gene_type:complete